MVGWKTYNTGKFYKHGHEVGRFCSFEKNSCARGVHWDVHKGNVELANYSKLKVMVKVCPDPNKSQKECQAEVKKLDLAETVIQMCPEKLNDFGVAHTYDAVVFRKNSKEKKEKKVNDGTKVVVQHRLDGQIRTLLDLEEEKYTCWDAQTRSPFHDFILEVYRVSGGSCVVSCLKGVRLGGRNCRRSKDDDVDYGPVKFLITSLTVHSTTKEFGIKDRGNDGIQAFLKSAGPAVPTKLLDADTFADKLKKKTASRERPVKPETVFEGPSSSCEPAHHCCCSENAQKSEGGGLLETILHVALTPTATWSGRPRTFMGRRCDSDDEYY